MANIEHVSIIDPDIHEPKDVATAASGSSYVADGAGSGAWQTSTLGNAVFVNVEADFPTPVTGVITLVADTNYIIGASISTANRFVLADGVNITANNFLSPILTYTGTGTMFTGVDTNFTIDHIRLDCATGQVFDMSESSTGGTKLFQCDTVQVDNCTKFGVFNKLQSNLIINSNCLNADDGIELLGSVSLITSLRQFALVSTSATFVGVDFGSSVQQTVEMTDIVCAGPSGAIGISGAAASANITTGFIGTCSLSTFVGGLTPLSGITVDDTRWSFQGNSGIPDSNPDGLLSMTGNATVTALTVGTPTLVLGTWVVEASSMFTGTTAGRLTYEGERDLSVPVDALVTIDPVSGTNKSIRAYITLNGTIITNSGQAINITSTDPKQIALVWQLILSEDDFLEIFIENETDSIDATVIDAILRIR